MSGVHAQNTSILYDPTIKRYYCIDCGTHLHVPVCYVCLTEVEVD